LAPIDLHAVLEAVAVANMAVDDKLRRIVPDDIKVGGQKVGKETASSRMQVTKTER
jgi:hypothetical protein